MRSIVLIVLLAGANLCYGQVARNQLRLKTSNGNDIRLDTIKIQIPRLTGTDALDTKLRHYKMKTPQYDNYLTGTHTPGDVNTGMLRPYTANPAPITPEAQKIRSAWDSARSSRERDAISPQ